MKKLMRLIFRKDPPKESFVTFGTSKLLLISCILLIFCYQMAQQTPAFEHFITRSGAMLRDGNQEFRFISFNVPNLLTVEDNLQFEETNPWRLPDKFEIEDALKAIKAIGGNVARTYVITVQRQDETNEVPKHVLGPGKFNEEAFQVMDQVLASANEIGVRLIIPFVDNWKWMGGKSQYAAFRKKDQNEFWIDPQIKEDFKKTVKYVLNRRNTISNIIYNEDKAIMAWELGNELRDAPTEWITEMAAYIKSIDANHLVNDGIQNSWISDEIIDNPNIDILSTHHYEKNPLDMIDHIQQSTAKIKGRKPYYIGEFGFISTMGMEAVLNVIINDINIGGALLWSLRFHNQDGGFYWHSEPVGYGLYKGYHYPGFRSGQSFDELQVFDLMRRKSFEIKGQNIPKIPIPSAPVFLPIKDVAHISWQGSVEASDYVVERSEYPDGPWQVVGNSVSDAACAYEPLFNDCLVEKGRSYYYRVFARNETGISAASNVVGPVNVNHYNLVDNMINFGVLFNVDGEVHLETGNTREFKEDFHRLAVKKGTEITYYAPGAIKRCVVYNFTQGDEKFLNVLISEDGREFMKVNHRQINFMVESSDYNYRKPLLVETDELPANMRYLKLKYIEDAQVGRVEIIYGD